jgi:hypothetical protein
MDTGYTAERPENRRDGGVPVREPEGELDRDADTVRFRQRDSVRAFEVDDRATSDTTDFEAGHERFGGIKWGSAFFGWLTATGAIVFLAAMAAGIGALVDQNTSTNLEEISQDPQSAGIVGGVVLGLILFIGYFCGGYVAGRMARFDGVRQGVAVWVWALIMAALFAGLGFLAGDQFDVGSQLSGLPSPPVDGSDRTMTAWIVGVSVVLLALLSAILGGKVGMRFHRKVDQASVTAY